MCIRRNSTKANIPYSDKLELKCTVNKYHLRPCLKVVVLLGDLRYIIQRELVDE